MTLSKSLGGWTYLSTTPVSRARRSALATLLCTGLCTPSGYGMASRCTSSLGVSLPPGIAVAHALLDTLTVPRLHVHLSLGPAQGVSAVLGSPCLASSKPAVHGVQRCLKLGTMHSWLCLELGTIHPGVPGCLCWG